MKVLYLCHGGFKNRLLREWPVTANGWGRGGGGEAFRTGPHVKKKKKKKVLELKITKKHMFTGAWCDLCASSVTPSLVSDKLS